MTIAPMRDTEPEGTDDAGTLTDGIHLVVDALKLNDVHTIYGVVGIPITDLARLAQASGIRYIGFRHESDAGHAAAAGTAQPAAGLRRHDRFRADGGDARERDRHLGTARL